MATYLTDFLKSLNNEEKIIFASIPFTGKEKALRDDYLKTVESALFDETILQNKHGFSKGHFDKTKTKILDKALSVFSDNDFQKRVFFLLDKHLYPLLLHLLKLKEKKLRSENDNEQKEAFYLLAFEAMVRFPFNDFPEKLLEYYCSEYINTLGENNLELRYAALAKKENVCLYYFFYFPDGAKKLKNIFSRLQAYQLAVSGKGWHFAEMRIFLALQTYYSYENLQKSYEYMTLAYEAAEKIYDRIDDRDKAFLLAMRAQTAFDMSRYREAIIFYEKALQEFYGTVSKRHFVPFHLVWSLLTEKDLSAAKITINKYLTPLMQNESLKNYHFDILRLYAIYYLLNGETEKAGDYLKQVLLLNKKDFMPYGDALYRFIHNIYVVRTGDWAYAADLCKKNLNFIYGKEIPEFDSLREMFLVLGHIIRQRSKGKQVTLSYLESNLNLGGASKLYGQLLELIIG